MATEVSRIREVARDRLYGKQEFFFVLSAQQLAIALGDLDLRQIVERTATDIGFAEELLPAIPEVRQSPRALAHRSWEVDQIQEDAQALLSGVSLPPHRRPSNP